MHVTGPKPKSAKKLGITITENIDRGQQISKNSSKVVSLVRTWHFHLRTRLAKCWQISIFAMPVAFTRKYREIMANNGKYWQI